MTDYYRAHHQAYHRRTCHLDPGSFLSPLAAALPAGASVLDVGCGSGRDLLWLKQRGYRVTGLERVAELASLARQAADCTVIQADFETFDFATIEADAVLLVGALVHLPHRKLPAVLGSILKALRPRGLALVTLKQGAGKVTNDDGRVFYLWQPPQLKPLFDRLGLTTKVRFTQPSITGATDIWSTHLLQSSAAA